VKIRHPGALLAAVMTLIVASCGGGESTVPTPPPASPPPPPPPPPILTTEPTPCVDGVAGDFRCAGVDLKRRVPLDDMGGQAGNDVWGWFDTLDGREYALMGMTNGTAFVDVSNPEDPIVLGRLPTATVDSAGRDIKVFLNHAYIVADDAGSHGMQVFDLTRLRGATGFETLAPDVSYGDFGSARNLAINERTGYAYAVGSDTCGGGLHMINIRVPNNPVFAGCHVAVQVQDAQCVRYSGPDVDYAGAEICFSSAGDVVEIANVSDKGAPLTLSTLAYPELGFVKQGWLTASQRYLFVSDEADETTFGANTRTIVIDVSDLDAPVYVGLYEALTSSIDHNLYLDSGRVFQANYTAGFRLLDIVDPKTARMQEVAFFDTHPETNAPSLDGAWSVYPFLGSGTILVSDIQEGLFLFRLQ
jgi:choice-of-anchor B domain-containing protein